MKLKKSLTVLLVFAVVLAGAILILQRGDLTAETTLRANALANITVGQTAEQAVEPEYPTALGKYLEKLKEAVPGLEEGPTSAAEFAFQERAYPVGTISVAQMNGAASAFESANGRPFPRGKGRPGTWVSVGPNEALYPFNTCGDWERLGSTPLTDAAWGDREGSAMAAIARTTSDTSTAWVATTRGRVFISMDVDADPASAVTWTRLDDDSAASPGRFVSGIAVDPANPNRAWVSYSGYTSNTPGTPGHVFEVVYDPNAGTSTWTDWSYDLGDIPITSIAYDDVTNDLYVSNDFGVLWLADGTTSWTLPASGMPNVEVAGLTIVPGERKLYAATHGLSAWLLNLR